MEVDSSNAKIMKPLVDLCKKYGLPEPRLTQAMKDTKDWIVKVNIEGQVIGFSAGKLGSAKRLAVDAATKFIVNKVIPLLEEQEEEEEEEDDASSEASGPAPSKSPQKASSAKATPSKASASPKQAASAKATPAKSTPSKAAAAQAQASPASAASFNMSSMRDALPSHHDDAYEPTYNTPPQPKHRAGPPARFVASTQGSAAPSAASSAASSTPASRRPTKGGVAMKASTLEKVTNVIRSHDRDIAQTTLIEQISRRVEGGDGNAVRGGAGVPAHGASAEAMAAGKEIVKLLTAMREEDEVYQGIAMFDRGMEAECPETALLGTRLEYTEDGEERATGDILMNVHEPFCLVTLGVQGAGKSHTVGVVIENCMLQVPQVTRLQTPMCSLVLHYDQSETNICEASTLIQVSPTVTEIISAHQQALSGVNPAVKKMIILVSPSFYRQRSAFYKGYPNCEVRALVFAWKSMTALQLKKLMCLEDKDNQLYVHVMLDLLRRFQRANKIPDFSDFAKEMEALCESKNQSSPLRQRFQVLESFIADAAQNQEFQPVVLSDLVEPGCIIVADLTDPMLSPQEANGVFQVLLEQFRCAETAGGKLIVFDEAHKYLTKNDALGDVIVDTVRQMRHLGMRVVVSTQSPQVLPAELLELVTIAVLHRFHSKDWFTYLSSKIPLPDKTFSDLRLMLPGQALIFSTHHTFETEDAILWAQIRQRLTADCGVSLTNQAQ